MFIGWGYEEAFWSVGNGLYVDWVAVISMYTNVNIY